MSLVLANLGYSDFGANPASDVKFGNKQFFYLQHLRPFYVAPSANVNIPKVYYCGIKPPIYYPTVTDSSDNAENMDDLAPGDVVYVSYAYYSSVRKVFSQMSPPTAHILPDPVKKLEISGFFAPRDGAEDQDIDTVVICVQSSVNPGLMCLFPMMSIKVDVDEWSTAEYVFDMAAATLNQGFNYTLLDQYLFIPPAVRYASQLKERIWMGGQLPSDTLSEVAMSATKAALTGTVSVTNGSPTLSGTDTLFQTELQPFDVVSLGPDSTIYTILSITDDTTATLTINAFADLTDVAATRLFRGAPFGRLKLEQPSYSASRFFDDSMLYKLVIMNGREIGTIIDIADPYTAYLIDDIPDNLPETLDYEFRGFNDRIWPSTFTTDQPGNVATPFPECVQLFDNKLISQGLDDGQLLMNLAESKDFLNIIFNQSVAVMVGGETPDSPLTVDIRNQYGRTGCLAPRSVCKDPGGTLAWVGEEGIILSDTDGIRSISHDIGCNMIWKGGQYIDTTTIPNIVMEYSRDMDGFVFGNFSYNTKTLTGTVAIAEGAGTVVGTGTSFLTEVSANDVISIGGYDLGVNSVNSATSISVAGYLGPTQSGETATTGKGWWGLLSLRPQLDLFLFKGSLMTSNIIEYPDEYGQGIILTGDAMNGRIKRLLDRRVLNDIQVNANTAINYVCMWREGWRWMPDLKIFSPVRVMMRGLVLPGSTLSMTLRGYRKNFVVRDTRDLNPTTEIYTQTITQDSLTGNMSAGIQPNAARFHSLGVEWVASSGSDGIRPMEVTRWQMFDQSEASPV